MSKARNTESCPSEGLEEIIQTLERDEVRGLLLLDEALEKFSDDPRLHFLKASMLAALQRYDEARVVMQHALDLAPDYEMARFQLGFLHLTSGDAQIAAAIWAPLEKSTSDESLMLFIRGLNHLARDEFAAARENLRSGMAINTANPALNSNMRQILDAMPSSEASTAQTLDPLSSVQMLLQQSRASSTKH